MVPVQPLLTNRSRSRARIVVRILLRDRLPRRCWGAVPSSTTRRVERRWMQLVIASQGIDDEGSNAVDSGQNDGILGVTYCRCNIHREPTILIKARILRVIYHFETHLRAGKLHYHALRMKGRNFGHVGDIQSAKI